MVLILGGARSGKSAMAQRLADEAGHRVTFVATAEPGDEEMRRRIEAHKAARPDWWRTVEEPIDIDQAAAAAALESDAIVIDCLTVWVSNHLCRLRVAESSEEWALEIERLASTLESCASRLVEIARSTEVVLFVVSNEVGLGLVPATPVGRAYRDLLGALNRRLAATADKVLLMVAGLPIDVKRLAAEGV